MSSLSNSSTGDVTWSNINTPTVKSNILHEIAGKKYVLIERQWTENNQHRLDAYIKKYKGMIQGIKHMERGGFLSTGHAIITILIPEENLVEYCNNE